MAAVMEAESDLNSSLSDDDDVDKLLADLDDLDADLFGKKHSDNKASEKASPKSTSKPHNTLIQGRNQEKGTTKQVSKQDESLNKSSTKNINENLADLLSDDDSLFQSADKKEMNSKLTTTKTTKANPTDGLSSTTPDLSSNTLSTPKVRETKVPAAKKAVTFNKEDDIFDGIGLSDIPHEDAQSSKSTLDYLFGRSSTEISGTPNEKRSGVSDILKGKSITDSVSVPGKNQEEDFTYGSYVPSAAAQPSSSSSVPASRPRRNRLHNKEEENKSNLLSGNSIKQSMSVTKSSFDDDDDDDDTFNWLMGISKEKKSVKTSASLEVKKTTKPKIEKEKNKLIDTDDDDIDDWLGMKKPTKNTNLNVSPIAEISSSAKSTGILKDDLPNKKETLEKTEKPLKYTESFELDTPTKSNETQGKSIDVPKSKPILPPSEDSLKSSVIPQNRMREEPEETMVKPPKIEEPPSFEPVFKTSETVLPHDSFDQSKLTDNKNTVYVANQNISQDFKLSYNKGHTEFNSPKLNLETCPSEVVIENEIKIRRLEIEKENLIILNETIQKRCSEEIKVIQESYKSRFQIMEDTQRERESRLRQENEELLKQNREKLHRLEDEKSALIQRHSASLVVFEEEKASEMNQLRESHRLALQQERQDFNETINRVKEARLQELEAINNFQSTNKSLNIVVEKINTNAQELEHYQMKLDRWQSQGMDEREVSLRQQNEQLKNLQSRLNRQQEENGRERLRLESLIEKLENQLHSQTQQLDDEKWKVKQEVNKYQALQVSIESDKRLWEEEKTRERAALDKCRNDLLAEQKRLMTQLTNERRALAEEKTRVEVSQKLWKQQEHQNMMKATKIETEFDVTMKALFEENEKQEKLKETLATEQRMLEKEQKKLTKDKSLLEEEKSQLFRMAAEFRERSLLLESFYANANKIKEEGELSLSKSNKLDLEHRQRWKNQLNQMDALTEREKQLAEQEIKIHHERQRLEELRKNNLCFLCRRRMEGTEFETQEISKVASLQAPNKHSGMFVPVQMNDTLPPTSFNDTLESMITDNWLTQWKIHSLKDQEFLFGENLYLATLERSQYLTDYTLR
ncbi:fas-binding factor 1 homolog isoform X1 [Argonauta hians]